MKHNGFERPAAMETIAAMVAAIILAHIREIVKFPLCSSYFKTLDTRARA